MRSASQIDTLLAELDDLRALAAALPQPDATEHDVIGRAANGAVTAIFATHGTLRDVMIDQSWMQRVGTPELEAGLSTALRDAQLQITARLAHLTRAFTDAAETICGRGPSRARGLS